MKRKIYISGKISGIEDRAASLFKSAQKVLEARGWEVVNPMELPHDHAKTWHDYMREDIRAMCDCHAIYMLSNWADSKGAIVEHGLAATLGLTLYYQTEASPISFPNEFSAR